MTVSLTKAQAEEVSHKIGILSDEPDLCSDYDITPDQARTLYRSIPLKGGTWDIPEWGVEAVKGEMEDHVQILLDGPAQSARDDREMAQYRSIIQLVKSLKSTFGLGESSDIVCARRLLDLTESDRLRGEWWIADGSLTFADGDVGDRNHEAHAISHLTGQLLDELGIEDDGETILLSDYKDKIAEIVEPGDGETVEQALIRWLGSEASPDVAKNAAEMVELAWDGRGDARKYALVHWGWKRVKGNTIETYHLTDDDLRAILSGVDEILREEGIDEGEEPVFEIYVVSTRKLYSDIPYDVIKSGNVSAVTNYQNVYHGEPVNEESIVESIGPVYHGTKTEISAFDAGHTGKGNDQLGSGFYFTTEVEDADRYLGGTTDTSYRITAYLDIKNPIRIGTGSSNLGYVVLKPRDVVQIIARAPDIYDAGKSPLVNWIDSSGKPYTIRDVRRVASGYHSPIQLENDFYPGNPTLFREVMASVTGYDGVEKVFENGIKHYVAWFPSQIKIVSADKIVRESIIDPVRPVLCPDVFDGKEIRRDVVDKVRSYVGRLLNCYTDEHPDEFYIKGSLLTYEYQDDTDLDVYIVSLGMSDEDLLAAQDMASEMNRTENPDKMVGTHPIEVYISNQPYPVEDADVLYDVTKSKWVKPPRSVHVDPELYDKEFHAVINKIDLDVAELKRDVIDYNLIKKYRVEGEELTRKISEIDDDVKEVLARFEELRSARHQLYHRKLTPGEIKKYGDSYNMHPANVIFKLANRFGYLSLMSSLKRLTDGGETSIGSVDMADKVSAVVSQRKRDNSSKWEGWMGRYLQENNMDRTDKPTVARILTGRMSVQEAVGQSPRKLVYHRGHEGESVGVDIDKTAPNGVYTTADGVDLKIEDLRTLAAAFLMLCDQLKPTNTHEKVVCRHILGGLGPHVETHKYA